MNDASKGRLDQAVALASMGVAVAVTVVMVVYRTGQPLAESVRRVLADPDVDEFVLIDNGSSPEEVELIDAAAEKDPRMTVLRGQGNVGFARAINMGVRIARGGIIVVLNPDAYLEKSCIRILHRALMDRHRPTLVGARVLNVDGSEQRGARRGEVTPVTSLLSLTGLARKVPALQGFEVHHEDDPAPSRGVPVPTISDACFAILKDDFFALGGFDTGYFLHVEDVDLCWRIRQCGGEVLFEPRARVVHLGSTSKVWPMKVEFWKGVGLARYFRKRADNPARQALAFALTPLIILVSVLRPLLRGQAFKARGGLRF
jgi:N-acetylglucosaminyl-diphospho-decaprenol L-rhamnosyltransferase